ncbi:MAG: YojF family protein [Mesobacillus sp.]|uniref:YojF family protein n=1 Tax=Bacillaceae TaxID=186817 RepID=UPI002FFFAEB6
MDPVIVQEVQAALDGFRDKEVYVHLETTNGAYASHNNESFFSSGAYIRNAKVTYERAKITGEGPYRTGLKIPLGWIYAEGITHFEIDAHGRLLLAGHDFSGKLAVALQISETPFE